MKIIVGYAINKQNEHELEILKKIVEPYVTESLMTGFMVYGYGSLENYNNFCLQMVPTGYEPKKMVPCQMVFNKIFITYDGYLTACCQDFDRELLIADLKKQSLKEAWVSERAIENKRETYEK